MFKLSGHYLLKRYRDLYKKMPCAWHCWLLIKELKFHIVPDVVTIHLSSVFLKLRLKIHGIYFSIHSSISVIWLKFIRICFWPKNGKIYFCYSIFCSCFWKESLILICYLYKKKYLSYFRIFTFLLRVSKHNFRNFLT